VRAVLDPGVIVAALITPAGVCGRALRAALDDEYTLVVSPGLLAELEGVLMREKFRRYISEAEAATAISLLARVAELRADPGEVSPISPDPDDDYLIALAGAAQVDYLISGDPHLVQLAQVEPPIVTPREFLEGVPGRPAAGS
jgi:putative PIN family toxin of toxin-antitoxin system